MRELGILFSGMILLGLIEAQCAKPDESVIELLLQNKTQFSSKELRTFRVRLQKGKAMIIDQKGFKE